MEYQARFIMFKSNWNVNNMMANLKTINLSDGNYKTYMSIIRLLRSLKMYKLKSLINFMLK